MPASPDDWRQGVRHDRARRSDVPAPGECEGAISTIRPYDGRGRDIHLIGDGEGVRSVRPAAAGRQPAFEGQYEVAPHPGNLVGNGGSFEISLGNNGSAGMFAIDT